MEDLPVVTVVTPVLNMARFVEETVQSVLDQDYPRIEYVVMDGGSTDGTFDILNKYKDLLILHSERDRGTADAVNRGFSLSTGTVFAYLNADDCYFPGAVSSAVRALQARPETDVVYGRATWVDEGGAPTGSYPVRAFDKAALARECFICQPASFMRRAVFERVGRLNPALHYSFDYDLWIRLSRFAKFQHIEDVLATSRMHRSNKSLGSRTKVFKETLAILKVHFGYVPFQWVYAYICYLMDRRDQFFEPLRPSFVKYLLSLPAGWHYNPMQPIRYTKDWASSMSIAGLIRRLGGARS